MDTAKILREHGLRVTPQRIAIYEALAGTKEHPSVEALYDRLRPRHPGLSLNTIYKTLQAFASAGLVRKLATHEDMHRYDANPEPHTHMVCIECGRVDDLDSKADERLAGIKDLISNDTDYDLVDHALYFYGYCPSCREKRNK
ncbi:MAG TPA: transcriptional repressor [Firmicutes bacterium]|nr:transcriptional repressor [Bacillota bacterium]